MKDFAAVEQEAAPLRVPESCYSETDAWWRRARAALPAKCKFLGNEARWAGSTVLQLQCESGIMADGLLRRGCDVTAVDTRAAMVDAAGERSAAHGYRISYRKVPRLHELPFADGQFDIVLCDHLFDRDIDLGPVLDEIARVTRRHGALMFSCTRPGLLAALRLKLLPGRTAPGLPKQMGRRRGITPRRLSALLEQAGFTPRQIRGLAARGLPGLAPPSYCTVRASRPLWLGTALKD
ncbi:class I SAM-dependent methyltransferase [Mangrovicoccus sp. HB161399]|uniref:class I SAM-dependent methyltransferase n=1 Tax=Mangrovicoccus sp. HB161399 TaxID=2720392 RepID=UPI0015574F1B|nr:class I SAM-dependent methyltransferase [Mangrovicoccus sp. HB161399]